MLKRLKTLIFGGRIEKCKWVDTRNVCPNTKKINYRCGLPKYGLGKPFIRKASCAKCKEFQVVDEY